MKPNQSKLSNQHAVFCSCDPNRVYIFLIA